MKSINATNSHEIGIFQLYLTTHRFDIYKFKKIIEIHQYVTTLHISTPQSSYQPLIS
jgi:hypothetical protein